MSVSSLTYLGLNSNRLQGHLPIHMGQLVNMITLDLSSNSLSGTISNELNKLANITILLLNKNRFTGTVNNNIFSRMKMLQYLNIGINFISGTIPGSLSQLPFLVHLELERNSFSGILPHFLGDTLNYLDVAVNQLTGSVPSSLCAGGKLRNLYTWGNYFSCYASCLISVPWFTPGAISPCAPRRTGTWQFLIIVGIYPFV